MKWKGKGNKAKWKKKQVKKRRKWSKENRRNGAKTEDEMEWKRQRNERKIDMNNKVIKTGIRKLYARGNLKPNDVNETCWNVRRKILRIYKKRMKGKGNGITNWK